MQDDRINGHEVDFAKINAGVTAMPKVGLNPYALGMRLLYHIREMEDKGRYSLDYFQLRDKEKRKKFDLKKGTGRDFIFKIRESYCDFTFINRYVDQGFVDRHKLFVAGRRLNKARMSWEYYIKSRRAEDYKQMVIDTLYHPPLIRVDSEETEKGYLFLVHEFEGKPLKVDFIENTMIGIEFLWGGPVRLTTWEVGKASQLRSKPADFWDPASPNGTRERSVEWRKVMYIMENRKLRKQEI